jgi:hypothetical protein
MQNGRWINGHDLAVYENLPGKGRASDYTASETGHPACASANL